VFKSVAELEAAIHYLDRLNADQSRSYGPSRLRLVSKKKRARKLNSTLSQTGTKRFSQNIWGDDRSRMRSITTWFLDAFG